MKKAMHHLQLANSPSAALQILENYKNGLHDPKNFKTNCLLIPYLRSLSVRLFC